MRTTSYSELRKNLAAMIDRVTPGDAGQFLDRDGKRDTTAW